MLRSLSQKFGKVRVRNFGKVGVRIGVGVRHFTCDSATLFQALTLKRVDKCSSPQ